MKILITADWHIGKRLHQEDLSEDMKLFFSWLLAYIEAHQINCLLIAGDVFDHHNPSNESTKHYFDFLNKLIQLECRAIITAGNHDSSTFLDIPRALLASYKIDVIGTYPGTDKPNELFFELKDKNNQVQAVIAAIPFLQDRFVRQVGEGEGAEEISQKIKQGIKTIFNDIGKSMRNLYPDLPRIGMAHLHAQGMHISEAERDIQIGNQDGVGANDLDQFDFLGLGHIHTGQPVISGRIEYAGSPVALGFTENNYQHKIIQLEITQNNILSTHIPIPKFRSLYQIKGTMDEVEAKLFAIQNKYALPVLLDIFIEEPHFDPTISGRIDILKNWCTEQGNIKIVQCRVRYEERVQEKVSKGFSDVQSHELHPNLLFAKMIEDRPDEIQKQQLLELFNEIVADATQLQG